MDIVFTKHAWKDYIEWQNSNKKIIERINKLIREILSSPSEGIGKPEPLKFTLAGYWSRRINDEHRLVYKVENNNLYIIQCKYHY